MPIEVLRREETERIVEDKLKKLLSAVRIAEKFAEHTRLEPDIAAMGISPTLQQNVHIA